MKTVFIHTPNLTPIDKLWEKTIRVGFPTATIDCHTKNGKGVPKSHSAWINSVLKNVKEDVEVIFCDPDMIFYDNVEETLIDSGQLMSGRFCPSFTNEIFRAHEYPRLHTSLLYIPSPSRLRFALQSKFFGLRERFGLTNWWAQQLTVTNSIHYFWDTGAVVYGAVGGNQFTTSQLNRFTHLNCGTMLDDVAPLMKDGNKLSAIHTLALTDPDALRGLWRKQDQYYAQHQNYADCIHP